jgi:hypothetical protein
VIGIESVFTLVEDALKPNRTISFTAGIKIQIHIKAERIAAPGILESILYGPTEQALHKPFQLSA